MKRRFSLFTYPVMDMKAAEAMLNRRAEQGWRLEKIRLGLLASFVPAEAPVCYCIDWIDPVLHPDRPSYAALLAEAGWRRRALVGSWAVYEAPAGTLPIQTDSALEYQRFRKKVLRRTAISGGILGAVCLLILLVVALALANGGRYSWARLAEALAYSNSSAAFPLLVLLGLAGGCLWLGRMALRLRQWKRAARAGEPFPVPGRVSAGAARALTLLAWLCLAAVLAAMALDILDGKARVGWAVGLAAGGLLAGKLYPDMDEELARRQRRLALGALVLAGVVLIAPWAVPSGLTDPLYPRRPMESVRLLPEEGTYYVPLSGQASLLASYDRWEEGAENRPAWLNGECWYIRSDLLAGRVAEEYLEELGPEAAELPGFEGVWTGPVTWPSGRTGEGWLLRRGNALLWLEGSGIDLDRTVLHDLLERLDGVG